MEIIEKDLRINSVSITKDVTTAMIAYRLGDYEMFGKQLGDILKLTTQDESAALIETMELLGRDRKHAAAFTQGFLEATKVGTFNFTNLLICIYEEDQAALILDEGVKLLEEAYEDKDWQEAIGGVIAMVAFVQQFKQGLPVCEAVVSDNFNWREFNRIVNIVEHPSKHMQVIEKDIFFNGVEITDDIQDSLEAFRSGDFKGFGKYLGEALYDATQENLYLY